MAANLCKERHQAFHIYQLRGLHLQPYQSQSGRLSHSTDHHANGAGILQSEVPVRQQERRRLIPENFAKYAQYVPQGNGAGSHQWYDRSQSNRRHDTATQRAK